jgi:hypothetical protein
MNETNGEVVGNKTKLKQKSINKFHRRIFSEHNRTE